MKNMMRKCISGLVIFVFLFTALTVGVSAAELNGSPAVTAAPPLVERNDFDGALGYCFTTTEKLEVYALGRPENDGITADHGVRLWDVSTETVVAEVVITPDSPVKDGFRYEVLAAPVTLENLTQYLVVSDEESGGDFWFDSDKRWYDTDEDFDVSTIISGKGFNFTGGCFGGIGEMPVNLNTQFVYVMPQLYYEQKGADAVKIDDDGTLKPFIKTALGGERNDISAFVGYEFMFFADADVISLARPDNGMADPHTLVLWDITNKTVLASATVDTNSPLVDGYRVADLAAPVTLKAGITYGLVSWEDDFGDMWHDIEDEEEFDITAIGTVTRGIWTGDGDASEPGFPSNPGPSVEGMNGYVGATVFYQVQVEAEETAPAETDAAPDDVTTTPAPQTSDIAILFAVVMLGMAIVGIKKTVKR